MEPNRLPLTCDSCGVVDAEDTAAALAAAPPVLPALCRCPVGALALEAAAAAAAVAAAAAAAAECLGAGVEELVT